MNQIVTVLPKQYIRKNANHSFNQYLVITSQFGCEKKSEFRFYFVIDFKNTCLILHF